jgi:hypothetical protein
VAQDVLVALVGGAEQVGPPEGENTRKVLRRVGILGGEVEAPAAQLLDDVFGNVDAALPGLVAEVEGAAVEARIRGRPAEPRRQGVEVGDGAPLEEPGALARGELLGGEDLVAPLVGGQVPVRERTQSRAKATVCQPVSGRTFSCPT